MSPRFWWDRCPNRVPVEPGAIHERDASTEQRHLSTALKLRAQIRAEVHGMARQAQLGLAQHVWEDEN